MTATRKAHELIGDEGEFRVPGGRATYDSVVYNDATARSRDKVRLARLDVTDRGGVHQVNRYVDWDADIEVIRNFTDEYRSERAAEEASW